ncbi:MAG: hypothetical protein JWP75_645, partial [Frondihabitans sp.]|nr:hypothetical protein [Frondihabitans sp.]
SGSSPVGTGNTALDIAIEVLLSLGRVPLGVFVQ